MTLDPVCKMYLDNKSTKKTILYKETTYHFCSTFCKELFDTNPEKFIEYIIEQKVKQPPLHNFSININETVL